MPRFVANLTMLFTEGPSPDTAGLLGWWRDYGFKA
jgi:hypothetical protein